MQTKCTSVWSSGRCSERPHPSPGTIILSDTLTYFPAQRNPSFRNGGGDHLGVPGGSATGSLRFPAAQYGPNRASQLHLSIFRLNPADGGLSTGSCTRPPVVMDEIMLDNYIFCGSPRQHLASSSSRSSDNKATRQKYDWPGFASFPCPSFPSSPIPTSTDNAHHNGRQHHRAGAMHPRHMSRIHGTDRIPTEFCR